MPVSLQNLLKIGQLKAHGERHAVVWTQAHYARALHWRGMHALANVYGDDVLAPSAVGRQFACNWPSWHFKFRVTVCDLKNNGIRQESLAYVS